MAEIVASQFHVVVPGKTGAFGTKVLVNGEELRNVYSVEVSNVAEVDDLVRSRITIVLAGEAITVEQGARENSKA